MKIESFDVKKIAISALGVATAGLVYFGLFYPSAFEREFDNRCTGTKTFCQCVKKDLMRQEITKDEFVMFSNNVKKQGYVMGMWMLQDQSTIKIMKSVLNCSEKK